MNHLLKVALGFVFVGAGMTASASQLQGKKPLNENEILISTAAAPAECIFEREARVCVGDQVIPEDFRFGTATVFAVDARYRDVLIRGDSDQRNYRRNIRQLFLTQACDRGFCAGENVIPDQFIFGTARIVGINIFRSLAMVLGNTDGRYYQFASGNLAATEGCLQLICVGDIVIPISFSYGTATVAAINFSRQLYVVIGNQDNRMYRFPFSEIR